MQIQGIGSIWAGRTPDQANPFYPSQQPVEIGDPSSTGGDVVDFSPQGLMASFKEQMGLDPDKPTISLADIEGAIGRDTVLIERQLKAIMADLGIDPSAELQLVTAPDGTICVNGEVPYKEALQEALNSGRSFHSAFKRLSANSSLASAIREALAFNRAYAEDPQAAVERYAYLLNDENSHHFTLTIENGEVFTEVTLFPTPTKTADG